MPKLQKFHAPMGLCASKPKDVRETVKIDDGETQEAYQQKMAEQQQYQLPNTQNYSEIPVTRNENQAAPHTDVRDQSEQIQSSQIKSDKGSSQSKSQSVSIQSNLSSSDSNKSMKQVSNLSESAGKNVDSVQHLPPLQSQCITNKVNIEQTVYSKQQLQDANYNKEVEISPEADEPEVYGNLEETPKPKHNYQNNKEDGVMLQNLVDDDTKNTTSRTFVHNTNNDAQNQDQQQSQQDLQLTPRIQDKEPAQLQQPSSRSASFMNNSIHNDSVQYTPRPEENLSGIPKSNNNLSAEQAEDSQPQSLHNVQDAQQPALLITNHRDDDLDLSPEAPKKRHKRKKARSVLRNVDEQNDPEPMQKETDHQNNRYKQSMNQQQLLQQNHQQQQSKDYEIALDDTTKETLKAERRAQLEKRASERRSAALNDLLTGAAIVGQTPLQQQKPRGDVLEDILGEDNYNL